MSLQHSKEPLNSSKRTVETTLAGQHPNDPERGCRQERKSRQDKLRQGAVGCHCWRKAGCIPVMFFRKKGNSSTPGHKLRTAQNELAEAAYRFRSAQSVNANNVEPLKKEMEFLERKVRYYRYCVYKNLPIKAYTEWAEIPGKCPKPLWA